MSTSKLQRRTSELLSTFLGRLTIRENYRPEWLAVDTGGCLELDFYIEELWTAIEVQGRQHIDFVPIFHKTYQGFKDMQCRDEIKRERCQQFRIDLFEVWNEQDALGVIEMLQITAFNKGVLAPQSPPHARHLWGHDKYPYTMRKQLRRLNKAIQKASRAKRNNDKTRTRIAVCLQAIEQYQETKGAVVFCSDALALMNAAKEILF